jgi:hypothetical protein
LCRVAETAHGFENPQWEPVTVGFGLTTMSPVCPPVTRGQRLVIKENQEGSARTGENPEVRSFETNPIPVRVAQSGGAMKDKDKVVTLIRLRDMLYFGVRPTLRQCGFRPEAVRELAKDGLIQLRDTKFGDDPDRYVIEEILPAGFSFILQQRALRDRLKQ